MYNNILHFRIAQGDCNTKVGTKYSSDIKAGILDSAKETSREDIVVKLSEAHISLISRIFLKKKASRKVDMEIPK